MFFKPFILKELFTLYTHDPASRNTNCVVHVKVVTIGKESPGQCRRCEFDPWLPRSPGEGNDNPLQYSCLGNSMDRGAWWATVPGVPKESDMTESLNNNNCEKMLKSSFLVVYTTTGYRSWALRTQIVAP